MRVCILSYQYQIRLEHNESSRCDAQDYVWYERSYLHMKEKFNKTTLFTD